MEDRSSFRPRQMVQGNWTCSGCGATITELPFEPRPGQDVSCRDCYQKTKGDRPSRRY
ncbi:MAG: CxxC-x17-CxxC domain-containing protein [Patescibacteria group bacterium]